MVLFAAMAEIVWINGRVYPRGEAWVSVFDHGFLYGDSIYETIRTTRGHPFLVDRHLERLRTSAAALHLELDLDTATYRRGLTEVLAAANNPESVTRVIVTRGEGDIGYGQKLCPRPTSLMLVRPAVALPPPDRRKSVRVAILSVLRNDPRTVSPAIKSGNLLNNILGAHEAEDRGADEGIMLNPRGQVAEGTMTNLFIVKDGLVLTPPLEAGILPGITRGFVLELARAAGVNAREAVFGPETFLAAEEAFLTSTTRAIQPIGIVNDTQLPHEGKGPVTRQLMAAFQEAENLFTSRLES
jgi:branched-chain amino acid aminotransferase